MAVLCQKDSGPSKHFTGELRRGLAHSGHAEDGGPRVLLSQVGLGLGLDLCGSQPGRGSGSEGLRRAGLPREGRSRQQRQLWQHSAR